MGTVIFKDAPYKVFLTASAEERAERRHKQLKDKGFLLTLMTSCARSWPATPVMLSVPWRP